MITFACMVRKFKDKFYFIDRLEFDKDKNYWYFSWPSSVGPSRFFPEEGIFKITGEDGKQLWILKVEKTKIKIGRLFLTDKNTSAIVMQAVSQIKLGNIKVDELILAVKDDLKKKIKDLNLPTKIS